MDQEKYNAGRDAVKELSNHLIKEWPQFAELMVRSQTAFTLFAAFFLFGRDWSVSEVKELIRNADGAEHFEGII